MVILIEVLYIITGKKIILVDKVIMDTVTVMVAGSLELNSTSSKVKALVKLNLLLREYPVDHMQQFQ